jgi:hypothetical protein
MMSMALVPAEMPSVIVTLVMMLVHLSLLAFFFLCFRHLMPAVVMSVVAVGISIIVVLKVLPGIPVGVPLMPAGSPGMPPV